MQMEFLYPTSVYCDRTVAGTASPLVVDLEAAPFCFLVPGFFFAWGASRPDVLLLCGAATTSTMPMPGRLGRLSVMSVLSVPYGSVIYKWPSHAVPPTMMARPGKLPPQLPVGKVGAE